LEVFLRRGNLLIYSRGKEPHLNLPGPALNNVNRIGPLILERVEVPHQAEAIA
jgi:hypothetical protein